jgi:Na+-transporting methylmalonyl-CoA/oxaloacetate decarboxylase gamma subunit
VIKATWFVLAGMGIVFATLTVLVLVMTVLNRWLPPAPENPAQPPRPGNA